MPAGKILSSELISCWYPYNRVVNNSWVYGIPMHGEVLNSDLYYACFI